MIDMQRGFRDKIEKYIDINSEAEVEMYINGKSVYDFCCFGVDKNNKLSDDRYMIFYNQTISPDNSIKYTADNNSSHFRFRLSALPDKINKLVFTASIDGNGTMGEISSFKLNLKQNGNILLNLQLSNDDFKNEKAIISVEIYKKDVWRIAVIASGFNGGLGDLLRAYGGEEAVSEKQKISSPPPAPAPVPELPKKVELRKGQKVNLRKSGNTLGEVLINLNWSQPKKTGFFNFSSGIDLDLGCLYELKNGNKGCVQALGNAFGSLNSEPYISLDGDDRTGSAANGENLRINGLHIKDIKRILVYTFIYEGAANWQEAQGIVTVKCPGSQEIIVKMDEYGSYLKMCAIAMIENSNDETFSVEKLVKFFRGHQEMDRCFGWNMRWVHGTK